MECPYCYNSRTAKTEHLIKDWIESLGIKTKKSRVNRKEIDIHIEDLKLGIEYCGLHWHCENSPEPRDKNYHIEKYKAAREILGINLITIFEDEWLKRQPQIKGFLLSALRKNSIRKFARKCEIREVEKLEAEEFLNAYHIQGMGNHNIFHIGIYEKDELLGIMSAGHHHRQMKSKNKIYLRRMCFKADTTVIGGASKLFKYFTLKCQSLGFNKIITWSDNRWTKGSVYRKLGFKLKKIYSQDYSYVKRQKRYSKQSLRLNSEERLSEIKEKELRRSQGYDLIWDCGKKRWEYKISSL